MEDGLLTGFLAGQADSNNNGNNGSNGGFGWGDGSWIFAILIFAMIFGWGNGGFGGGWGGGNGAGIQGALTRGDLCSEFSFNDLQNAVRGVQQGICDSTFALNNTIVNGFAGVNNAVCSLGYEQAQLTNGVNMNLMQGFNAANVVALQNQNALSAQLADCCCTNRVGQMQLQNAMDSNFCTTNYNAATNTTAIIQNAHNDTDRVLAKLDAMEMARKDETIADLRAQLASCGDQTTAQYIINQLTGVISPRAVPAYPAASPCGLGNWSSNVLANSQYYNGGCGCNSGCCGCNG